MTLDWERIVRFIVGAVTDPKTKDLSSARALAILFGVVGCIVALKYREAGVVAALVAGGAVAIINRTTPKEDDDEEPEG